MKKMVINKYFIEFQNSYIKLSCQQLLQFFSYFIIFFYSIPFLFHITITRYPCLLLNKFLQYLTLYLIFDLNMNIRFKCTLLILVFYIVTLGFSDPTPLTLDQNLHQKLPALIHKQYIINLTSTSLANQSLFISAQSPFNDPFQQPILLVNYNNISKLCDEQSASYTGICKIQPDELKNNKEFTLDIYCLVDCNLDILAYLSEMYQMNVGRGVQIQAQQDYGVAQLITINIPNNTQYTGILVLASVYLTKYSEQGFTMVANYGSNITNPSKNDYKVKGQSSEGHRVAIKLARSQINPGQKIILYTFVGANSSVDISTYIMVNKALKLTVGSPMLNFIADDQTREYYVDLTSNTDIEDKDIMIKFIVFSGDPDIEVSFDPSYAQSATEDNWLVESSFAFLLSPALRKEKKFDGKIYIKIHSAFSANYHIEVIINRKQFISLQNQVMQLAKVPDNYFQNFIYEDQNYVNQLVSDNIKYKATIEMMSGAAEIGIRDCDSLMRGNNVTGCLIKTLEQLNSPGVRKSFDNVEGQMKRRYNIYQLYFEYNVTTCPKASIGSSNERYICDFHIFVRSLFIPNAIHNQLYLGIEILKYTEPKILKQGVITRDEILQDQLNYYSFELLSTDNIEKIQIYTTVLQGDISLLISKKLKYPNYQNYEQDKDIKFSIIGSIVLEGTYLTPGIYYVSVYGYQLSEYTISVALQRRKNGTDNPSESTEIQLKKGLSQKITMGNDKTTMKFVINSNKNETIVLKVNSVTGTISYKIQQQQKYFLVCDSKSAQDTVDKQCKFDVQQGKSYLVTVYGARNQIQIFYISYNQAQSCLLYSLDQPMYLELSLTKKAAGDKQCYLYLMPDNLQDTQITLAMSEVDKLKVKGMLDIKLVFPISKQTLKMEGYEKILTKQQLQILCTPQKTQNNDSNDSSVSLDEKKECYLQIRIFLNTSDYTAKNSGQSVQLLVAVQGFDEENVLFDGIPQKVISQKLSTLFGKKFYYYILDINQISDLTIFLTSQTASRYQIVAKIIDDTTFLKDFDNIQYPTFNSNQSNVLIANSSLYSPITVLTVKKSSLQSLAQSATTNVVLISVFGLSSETSETAQKHRYVFKLEATFKSTALAYGQTKIGYVDKDSIYQYEVSLSEGLNSILSVRSMGSQKCLSSYLETRTYIKQDADTEGSFQILSTQFKDVRPFISEKGDRKILVKGISNQICTYQITFNSIQNPLRTVFKSVPYEINIQETEKVSYYLFYSNTNDSLLILQMINGGNSMIYAYPINEKAGDTVESLMNKNLDNYYFRSQLNGNINIDKNSPKYCVDCYYLIAVKGKPVVSGELIVNAKGLPLPLKEGSIIKDKLGKQQKTTFQFYSVSTFNVSISMIYGKVDVLITTPDNKTITKYNLSSMADILIAVNQSSQSIDYFDQSSRYLVTVTSLIDSSYSITVKKSIAPEQLYEGIPANIEISGTKYVRFTNFQANKPLNVLIQDLNYREDQNSFIFDARTTNEQFMIKEFTQSQGSYNLQFKSIRGEYELKITTGKPTNVSILLVKNTLNHLIATRASMFSNYGVFQVFSPGDSIMIQIFSCKSDIEVVASSNYTKLVEENDQGIIRMEHANYGGHYVISSQNLQGQFFLLTKPSYQEDKQIPLYVISYYLYSPLKGQKMPYRLYSIRNTNIDYSYKAGIVEFKLNKIFRLDNSKSNGQAIYTLFISNNTESITKMTKCSLGNVYKIIQTFQGATVSPSDSRKSVVFSLKFEQIRQAIGNSKTYFVGAEATFSWKQAQPHHAQSVQFVYDISQLLSDNSPEFKEFSSKEQNVLFVLLWIAVPFLFGSFVMYLAIKYFLTSVRYRPTNQLMEEDDGHSEQVFNETNPVAQQSIVPPIKQDIS